MFFNVCIILWRVCTLESSVAAFPLYHSKVKFLLQSLAIEPIGAAGKQLVDFPYLVFNLRNLYQRVHHICHDAMTAWPSINSSNCPESLCSCTACIQAQSVTATLARSKKNLFGKLVALGEKIHTKQKL